MSRQVLFLILISVGLSASAQVALKLGATQGSRGESGLNAMIGILTTPWSLVGLTLYGLSALLWLRVLSLADLSVAYAFVGLSFIFTLAAGAWLFDERVTMMRVAGTLLISAGVVMVAMSAQAATRIP